MNLRDIFILFNLAGVLPSKIKETLYNLNHLLDFDIKELLLRANLLTDGEKTKILKILEDGILEKELDYIKKEGIEVIDIFNKDYPILLKEIIQPPPILYLKGNVKILNEFLFAIVGSRIPTIYGISMAEEFSYKLSSLGLVIVSGLARGIDSLSHRGAIKGGRTVAVLGSGLCNIYPRENKKLAEEIFKKGAVISEFPLKYPPLKENFPRRNRIISGLSRGVLVIEAGIKSGALITARYALEQNREVFALPGKIDSPLSKGTHLLIKQGAKLVDSIVDILEELNIELKEEVVKPSCCLTSTEKEVFDMIDRDGSSIEELILKTKLDQSVLNGIVLNLQLKGLIKETRASYFTKLY